jgi:hypothetical protein
MKKKAKISGKKRSAPKRKRIVKKQANAPVSAEEINYEEPAELIPSHDEYDDDWSELDDMGAGREGEHTSFTGSTNNSRFGGKLQYGSKNGSKKQPGGDGQTGYFWARKKGKKG